jgi:Cu/Ag efflux pump CusA
MNEGSIVLIMPPPCTSLNQTDRILRELEKIIRSVPEVSAYSRRTGTQIGFFITEPNNGDYLIQLKTRRNKTTEEVIADIRKQVEASQPALRIDFGQVITDMLGDLMTSVQPIEVKIFGENQEQLHALSKQVADIVSSVKGTADVFDGIVIAGPSITVTPDYGKIGQFGITPASLQYQLQTHLEGNIVGDILEKEQQTPIRMVFPNNRRTTISDIAGWQIFLPS